MTNNSSAPELKPRRKVFATRTLGKKPKEPESSSESDMDNSDSKSELKMEKKKKPCAKRTVRPTPAEFFVETVKFIEDPDTEPPQAPKPTDEPELSSSEDDSEDFEPEERADTSDSETENDIDPKPELTKKKPVTRSQKPKNCTGCLWIMKNPVRQTTYCLKCAETLGQPFFPGRHDDEKLNNLNAKQGLPDSRTLKRMLNS
jgi:hypothetical protein